MNNISDKDKIENIVLKAMVKAAINEKCNTKIENEEKKAETAERIEITFKNGNTVSYGKNEWDDYSYDGKAVIVKRKGAWTGIYNFDDVFCVELKEK